MIGSVFRGTNKWKSLCVNMLDGQDGLRRMSGAVFPIAEPFVLTSFEMKTFGFEGETTVC